MYLLHNPLPLVEKAQANHTSLLGLQEYILFVETV